MAKLVLWDIDHTLIEMRGVGGELFGRAFRQTMGVTMERQASVDGMTDSVIFRETARIHGLAPSGDDFARFAVALAELHHAHMLEIRERGHALPGAASALGALARLPGLHQTVVTGNIRTTAHLKLRAFGMDTLMGWEAGAFGEDGDIRADLVATALRRATSVWGTQFDAQEVTLIGDTPADMEGACAHGLRTLGVATGRSSEEDLRAAGAALTLPDLGDTTAVLQAVGQG